MTTETITPIVPERRLAIIDILRGWALLGVVLMNYTDVYTMLSKPHKLDNFSGLLMGVGSVVFEAKSWTLLSFLFGYGFAVLIDNLTSKGIKPAPFFLRRMFWLLVLAFINSMVFFGDILKDYAVLGIILLLFYKVPAKTAFYISLALLVINPASVAWVFQHNTNHSAALIHYLSLYQSHSFVDIIKCGLGGTYYFEFLNPFYSIVCHIVILLCFFLGLAAQKVNFFGRLAENKKQVIRIFWCSLAVALFFYAAFKFIPAKYLKPLWRYYGPMFWQIISSMLCIASGICWLYLAGKLRRIFDALQVYGRMTLTNYLVQNILAVLVFSGVGLGLGSAGLSYGVYMLIALAIYIAQIFFSKWWLARHYFGPAEWLWRQLSYAQRLPLKRK
jgi:uncharacterized protein